MTYEESYKKTKTLEELRQEVNSDIATALIINRDRIPMIVKTANKVANEKYNIEDLNLEYII